MLIRTRLERFKDSEKSSNAENNNDAGKSKSIKSLTTKPDEMALPLPPTLLDSSVWSCGLAGDLSSCVDAESKGSAASPLLRAAGKLKENLSS
jgi:hypothetical protein